MNITLMHWLNCRKSRQRNMSSLSLKLMAYTKNWDYSRLLKYITFGWENSCSDIIIKCYPDSLLNISQNTAKFTATAQGSQNYFDCPIVKKNLGRRCISFMEKIIVADINLDTSQPVFKRNFKRCLQHGLINIHEKRLFQFHCFCYE